MDWLIVSVDVKKGREEDTSLWQAIPLYFPYDYFIVQLGIMEGACSSRSMRD